MANQKESKRNTNENNGMVYCSFCGKPSNLTASMVSGPNGIHICDECIMTSASLVFTDLQQTSSQYYSPTNSSAKDDVCSSKKDSSIDKTSSGNHSKSKASASKNQVKKGLHEKEDNSMLDTSDREEYDEDSLLSQLPTPRQLYEALSEHVVGQEKAKRALSVAVYNHYKRIALGVEDNPDEVELAKSNILLLGPTGSGKTLLAQTLARTLQVPFAIADATTLTEAGYVGEDVENILLKLITAADFDIPLAEIGIIYIDEIDKIARKAENLSITRDVSGEGVQQALLKIVEGCEASVPPQGGRKHPQQELIHIDTTNILFILGGAFVGLSDIVSNRVNTSTLGFNSEMPKNVKQSEAELLSQVLPEDLHTYGMIPEFVGRIPVITALSELDEDDLIRVLTEPKNALVKQYVRMFSFEDCELVFAEDALREIAASAIKHKTGARGLRSICESVLQDLMFDLPEQDLPTKVTIRKSDVTGETKPELTVITEAVQDKETGKK